MSHFFRKSLSNRIILLSVLFFILFLFLSTKPAHAALDTYTVTGGSVLPALSLPEVGEDPILLSEIVITEDDAMDDFTNDPETIEIAISSDFNPVVFDDSITNITVGGTCGYDGHDALIYSGDLRTVSVPVTGGGCDANQTITIQGLMVETLYSQVSIGSQPMITVDNPDSSAGSPVATTNIVQTLILPATVTMSATFPDPLVGAVQNTTITINPLPYPLVAGDEINFFFPSRIDITGVLNAVNGSLENGGQIDCSDSGAGQLTCEVIAGPTALSGDIIVTGITPSDAGADTGAVFINFQGNSSNRIAQDTEAFVSGSSVFNADASVTLSNPFVGVLDNIATLSLELPVNLDNNDTITFTAPDVFDVSSTAFLSTSFLGTGFSGCAAVDNLVTCTVDTDLTAGAEVIDLSGWIPRYRTVGNLDEITDLQVTDVSAGDLIASDYDVIVDPDIAPADAAATVTLLSPEINQSTEATIEFTVPIALEADDFFQLTFPPHMNLEDLVIVSTNDFTGGGQFGLQVSGQEALFVTDGVIDAGMGSVTVSGLTSTSSSASDAVDFLLVDDSIGPFGTIIALDLMVDTTDTMLTEALPGEGEEGELPSGSGCSWPNCPDDSDASDDPDTDTGDSTEESPSEETDSEPDTEPDTAPDAEGRHPFVDVPAAWAELLSLPLGFLFDRAIVQGRDNDLTNSDADQPINRAEVAKTLSELFSLEVPQTPATFEDIDYGTDIWYNEHVAAVSNPALTPPFLRGADDGHFYPGFEMNIAELAQIIYNIMVQYDLVDPDEPCTLSSAAASRFTPVTPDLWYYKALCHTTEPFEVNGQVLQGGLLPAAMLELPGVRDIPVNPGDDALRGTWFFALGNLGLKLEELGRL